MKKVTGWFGKQAKWLKTVLIVLLLIVGVALVFAIIKIVKNIGNGAKGITDALGLTKSDAQKHAETDSTLSAWGTDLYTHNYAHATLNSGQLLTMATDIYDSWGFFADDFDKTFATIKKCHNKVDVSGLCQCFVDKYKKDLLSYIVPGTWHLEFRNRMGDSQFEMIHNFVNSLPNE